MEPPSLEITSQILFGTEEHCYLIFKFTRSALISYKSAEISQTNC